MRGFFFLIFYLHVLLLALGLCRTCEIFGASALVLDSLRHVNDKQFQSLSVTSERWLSLLEVKCSESPHIFMFFTKKKKSAGSNRQTLKDCPQTAALNRKPKTSCVVWYILCWASWFLLHNVSYLVLFVWCYLFIIVPRLLPIYFLGKAIGAHWLSAVKEEWRILYCWCGANSQQPEPPKLQFPREDPATPWVNDSTDTIKSLDQCCYNMHVIWFSLLLCMLMWLV